MCPSSALRCSGRHSGPRLLKLFVFATAFAIGIGPWILRTSRGDCRLLELFMFTPRLVQAFRGTRGSAWRWSNILPLESFALSFTFSHPLLAGSRRRNHHRSTYLLVFFAFPMLCPQGMGAHWFFAAVADL